MWDLIKTAWQREPLVILAAVQALIESVIVLVVAFGVSMNEMQIAAILGTSSALLALITALIGRSQVSPVSSLRRQSWPRPNK